MTTSYNRQDERGRYSLVRLDSKTLGYVASLDFPIQGPDGSSYVPEQPAGKSQKARWRWGRDKVASEYASLVFEKGYVYTKNYESEGARPRSLMAEERFGVTRTGKAEAESAIGQNGIFEFPKPVRLIQHLLRIGGGKDALVLDFFAGSGTTAQAVMEQNALDGGSRRFVLVQLPEPTPGGSEARSLGYANISEIGRARISGAGDKINRALMGASIDVGFRAYKLADTNFAKWRLSSDVDEDALQQHLLSLRDSATDDASADQLLTEILLKQGYSLTEAVSPAEVGGLDVRLVRDRDGDVAVLAFLNEHVKPMLDQLRALVDEEPTRIIVLEDAFQGDDELKTNLAQLAKSKGIELWTA